MDPALTPIKLPSAFKVIAPGAFRPFPRLTYPRRATRSLNSCAGVFVVFMPP